MISHWSANLCKGEGSQWLSGDEPIIKIVAKMLEVIVTKPPSATHKTMLLQRFHQVGALFIIGFVSNLLPGFMALC